MGYIYKNCGIYRINTMTNQSEHRDYDELTILSGSWEDKEDASSLILKSGGEDRLKWYFDEEKAEEVAEIIEEVIGLVAIGELENAEIVLKDEGENQ